MSFFFLFAQTATPTSTVSLSDVVSEVRIGTGIDLSILGFLVGVWLLWRVLT
jgi:hypothetical protein